MIKKKVTKNVVLSAAELEYLAAALKEEILILRGQVVKAGAKYTYTKDKKILNFLKNEEMKMEGAEGAENTEGGDENAEEEGDKPNDKPIEQPTPSVGMPSAFASSRGNMAVRRRQSLLHIDEETIIMKYCEVKAKLENLEIAIRNKNLNESSKEAEADLIIDEVREDTSKKILEIEEKKLEEVGKVNDTLEKIKEEFLKEKIEYEKKYSVLEVEKLKSQDELETCKKELAGVNDIIELIENDNKNIQEKFEKKKLKYKQLKEKNKEILEEKATKKDDMEKLSNEINDLKIKDIDQLKEIEKLRAENIAQSKILSENEKTKLLTDKVDSILNEITSNKKEVLSLSNKEKSMSEEIEELKRKLKDQENEITNQAKFLKEKDDRIQSLLSSNEAKEIRNNNEMSNADTK
jgi:DNA repair exonuclease SbcCD ATPase subunit